MERNNTALTGIKMMIADGIVTQEAAEKYFPELKESEDEKILRVLKEGFEIYNKGEWYGGITNEQILAWLEKQGEQKPAWSEDDEGICRAIINDIANDKSMCTFDISKGICDEQINWLKSLKERVACEANRTTAKQWKPSERQFQSIRDCALNKNIDADTRLVLDVLYQDLLKLREK